MKTNILGVVILGKQQLQKLCLNIFLNISTEAEEEEFAAGNKFPGNENCILSQVFNTKRLSWTVVFCNVTI